MPCDKQAATASTLLPSEEGLCTGSRATPGLPARPPPQDIWGRCADTHATQGRRVHAGARPRGPAVHALRFFCIDPHGTAASLQGKKTHEANRKENQSVLTTAHF